MIIFFKKYSWIIAIICFFYVCVYLLIIAPEKKNNDYYLSTYKFNFRGRIIAKKEIDHNTGYICLDLISSDIERFNPSDSLDDYLCIIDNKRAIVKSTGINTLNMGEIYEERADSCFFYSKDNMLIEKGKKIFIDWIQPPESFNMCK